MSAEQANPLPRLRMGTRVVAAAELGYGRVNPGDLGTVIDAIPGSGPIYYVVKFDHNELAQELTVSEAFLKLAPSVTFP